MPQTEGQSEQPSMEEILASIRRIIAEDAETPAPAAAVQAAPPPAVTPPEEDILELTEKVEDDGRVVSIAAGARKAAASGTIERTHDERQPSTDALFEKKPMTAEKPSRPEPPPLESAPPPAPPPMPELRAWPEPTIASAPPSAPASPPEPPPAAHSAEERLVSSATAAASVAALAQLADLGQSGVIRQEPLGEGGRTLESLVRELLRPMLKSWLDSNLAPLVERLVREEIQRMAREVKGR